MNRFNFHGLSRSTEAVETAKTAHRLAFHRAKAAVLTRRGEQVFTPLPEP
jgi:hypothetical protein